MLIQTEKRPDKNIWPAFFGTIRVAIANPWCLKSAYTDLFSLQTRRLFNFLQLSLFLFQPKSPATKTIVFWF